MKVGREARAEHSVRPHFGEMSVTNVNSENVNGATVNNVELGENNKLYAINAERVAR